MSNCSFCHARFFEQLEELYFHITKARILLLKELHQPGVRNMVPDSSLLAREFSLALAVLNADEPSIRNAFRNRFGLKFGANFGDGCGTAVIHGFDSVEAVNIFLP